MERVVNGWQAVLGFSRLLGLRPRHPAVGGTAPTVLAFVSPGHSRLMLQRASCEAGWTLTISGTPPAEATRSAQELAPIILFDRELPPGNWREAVGILSGTSPRPYIILLSPHSDGNLWDELQRAGGSDILRTPVDPQSILQAVGRAWSLWRSQQQVRLPLQTHR